jgi:hypothetical protein
MLNIDFSDVNSDDEELWVMALENEKDEDS